MSLNAADTEKAKEIVNQLVWQPVEGHNYRYTKAVNTLTRFCEAASMEPDVARLVIEYLKNEVISDGISLLNKRMDFGSGWKAMDAWYQTAAGEKFAGTESTKVRVFQVLMQPPADGDTGDGPYLVEDGCQYKVSHTFYWNVEELPELDESSSGIQYTMQGITRDSVTGLYSCVVEERERVQQDVQLYDSSKSIYETIKREAHIGVKAADLPTTGQQASVAGGVLVERQVTKNGDCTSNVENTVRKEEPVSGALVNVRRTIRGIWKRITERNQEPDATETDPSVEVGETAEREKTPGDLRNNTKTTFESAAANGDIDLVGEHELTALEHSDMKSVVLQDDSKDTPEPQTLTIEDVPGVTTPLPIKDNETKPEGFSGEGDQAGGEGRKIVRKRIVVNEETGQRDRQIIERTSIPYKKMMTWIDDNAAHCMLVFRNQKTVPQIITTFTIGTTAYTSTDTSPSVSINEFGLFDGVYHYTSRGAGSGSPETTGTWDKVITIKERYVKPGGKTFCRTYTVTKYVFHGAASGAINKYLEGTEYPGLGLHSWKNIHGQRGDAEWYGDDLTLTDDGPEQTKSESES